MNELRPAEKVAIPFKSGHRFLPARPLSGIVAAEKVAIPFKSGHRFLPTPSGSIIPQRVKIHFPTIPSPPSPPMGYPIFSGSPRRPITIQFRASGDRFWHFPYLKPFFAVLKIFNSSVGTINVVLKKALVCYCNMSRKLRQSGISALSR